MNNNNITFIITSVIHFNNKPLSYTTKRSSFNPDQREKQTIKTINSIKEKMPGAKIFLIELGNKNWISTNTMNSVDKYIYLGDNFFVRKSCNSKYKGLGEAIGLIFAKKYIKNKANFYFKISGRYYLNEKFNIKDWGNLNKLTAKKYNQTISTRLYGFPKNLFNQWFYSLIKSIPSLIRGKCIEMSMIKNIDQSIVSYIKNLGISGKIASTGNMIKE